MNAKELFQAGRLADAIQSLTAEVRSNPTDSRRRSFLFELLSLSGEFDRAAKHLDVLAQASPAAEVGALLYKSAIAAERHRQALFSKGEQPAAASDATSGPGLLNGKPFNSIEDADPRLGCRLEAFVAGEYMLIPFRYIGSFQLSAPRSVRDLIWSSAILKTSSDFAAKELGEVLVPVLYPLSWQHANEAVKLGRATEWQELQPGMPVPLGQKMLVVDGEEVVPLLEVRDLQFSAVQQEASSNASSS
jgi:type VI secretion system protein ImpE